MGGKLQLRPILSSAKCVRDLNFFYFSAPIGPSGSLSRDEFKHGGWSSA